MGFCKHIVLESESDALQINHWVRSAIFTLSEGSYSFPSGYMINGKGLLPAYPMRVACDYLSKPMKGRKLLEGSPDTSAFLFNLAHHQRILQIVSTK